MWSTPNAPFPCCYRRRGGRLSGAATRGPLPLLTGAELLARSGGRWQLAME
jgi:hypothetical protein